MLHVPSLRTGLALPLRGAPTRTADVIRLLRGRGTLSAADLSALGISRQYSSVLRQRGVLERVGHGASRLAYKFEGSGQ